MLRGKGWKLGVDHPGRQLLPTGRPGPQPDHTEHRERERQQQYGGAVDRESDSAAATHRDSGDCSNPMAWRRAVGNVR